MSKYNRLLAHIAPTVAAQLEELQSAVKNLGDGLTAAALAAQKQEAEHQQQQERERLESEQPKRSTAEELIIEAPSPTRCYRVREVAARLSVDPQTVWRWTKAGKFPQGVRIGPGRTIWTEATIAQWLDQQRAKPGKRRQSLPRERPKLRFVQSVHKGSRRWRAAGADGADYVITESLKLRTGTRLIDTIYLVQQGDRQLGEAPTLKEAKALARADADRKELVP